jgi:hypothetical protein
MSNRVWMIVLVGAVLGAAGFALGRADSPASTTAHPWPAALPASEGEPSQGTSPHAALPQGALPPNHPPIGDTPRGPASPTPDDAAITWKVPAAWRMAPNPNPMRIATYRVPATDRDTDDAEASVSRAGGTAEANIQRWLGQFDQAGQETRSERTVGGMKVTIVEVSGTYSPGSMMGGAPPPAHPGWALMGAIVEGRGLPYFFKLIGPRATMQSARASFTALLDSITPG